MLLWKTALTGEDNTSTRATGSSLFSESDLSGETLLWKLYQMMEDTQHLLPVLHLMDHNFLFYFIFYI